MGTEIYRHGILDCHNRDNRKLAEVKQGWERVQKIRDIGGSWYAAEFGLLRDYGSMRDAGHRRLQKAGKKAVFNDVPEAEAQDANALATYETNYYAGSPAMIERRVGQGRVIHFDGTFERETVDAVLEYFDSCAPGKMFSDCPKRVKSPSGSRTASGISSY